MFEKFYNRYIFVYSSFLQFEVHFLNATVVKQKCLVSAGYKSHISMIMIQDLNIKISEHLASSLYVPPNKTSKGIHHRSCGQLICRTTGKNF